MEGGFIVFPACREPLFRTHVADSHPARIAWSKTQQACQQLISALHEAIHADAELRAAVLTVAASGSMGRMEMSSHSDCDLLVVLNQPAGKAVQKQVVTQIWRRLTTLGWQPPKADGIYASAAIRTQLVECSTLGQLEESRLTFGQRIQLLLDCQPLFNTEAFVALQRDILERYATARRPGYLTNELIAYYRCLLNWHAHRDVERPAKWRLRQVKLGHSRAMMYAGLLLHLGDWEQTCDHETLLKVLQQTSLERVLDLAEPDTAQQILREYGFYLEQIATHAEDGCQQHFDALMENSNELRSSLFTVAMQNNVDNRLATSLM